MTPAPLQPPSQSHRSRLGTMRILFWNEFFAPLSGGSRDFLDAPREATRRAGPRRCVAAAQHLPALPKFEMIAGIEVHRLPSSNVFRVTGRDATSVGKIADGGRRGCDPGCGDQRQISSDVVHVNFAGARFAFSSENHEGSPCCDDSYLPSLRSIRDRPRPVCSIPHRGRSSLVAVSQAAARNVAEMTGAALDRMAIIAPGIAAEDLRIRRSAATPDVPTFAFLGRLVHEKGADIAVEGGGQGRVHAGNLKAPHHRRRRGARSRWSGQIKAHGAGDFINLVGPVDDAAASEPGLQAALLSSLRRATWSCSAWSPSKRARRAPGDRSRRRVRADRDRQGRRDRTDGAGRTIPTRWPRPCCRWFETVVASRMGVAGRARAIAEYDLETTVDRYESLLTAAANAARRGGRSRSELHCCRLNARFRARPSSGIPGSRISGSCRVPIWYGTRASRCNRSTRDSYAAWDCKAANMRWSHRPVIFRWRS